MRVRDRLRRDTLEIKSLLWRGRGFQMKYREILDALGWNAGIRNRLELLIFNALREVGIRQGGRGLRL
jgi:hypothetical protein